MAPEGVTRPLSDDALDAVLARIEDARPESVAVCLLHSYVDPGHERAVAQALSTRLPDVHVSSSHEVLSVFREYERTSTTVIDAYLSPLISALSGAARRARLRAGLPSRRS